MIAWLTGGRRRFPARRVAVRTYLGARDVGARSISLGLAKDVPHTARPIRGPVALCNPPRTDAMGPRIRTTGTCLD